MWIKKKEYKRLKTNAEFWEKEYNAISERKVATIEALVNSLKDAGITIDNLNKQVESLKAVEEELQEYKQKYIDEVQKRLELAKLLENNT